MRIRGQGAFEYVLLLAGILLVAVIAVLILRSNVFPSANAQISNNTQVFQTTTCLKTWQSNPDGVAGVWRFDDGGGTLASDDSGKSGTGTLKPAGFASTGWQPASNCIEGSCLQFDGTTTYVDLGNPASLQITGSETIEFWIKPTNFLSPNRQNPFDKSYCGEGAITLENSGSLSYYYGTCPGGNPGGSYQGWGSSPIALNAWTHMAIVRDLSNLKLTWFKNGVQDTQTAAIYPSSTGGSLNAFIGRGYANYFVGSLDDVVVYSRALSASEIANDYRCRG